MSDFETFDPNAPNTVKHIWAIWNGYRFRTFSSRGAAMNSFRHEAQARLFEHDKGRWEERARKDGYTGKPTICDSCGGTTMLPRMHYDYQRDHRAPVVPQVLDNDGEYRWDRTPSGKLVEPLNLQFLCGGCR